MWFYGRLDKEYVTIDNENQTIEVAGAMVNKNYKIFENALTIDYKNKTLTTHYPDHEDVVFK